MTFLVPNRKRKPLTHKDMYRWNPETSKNECILPISEVRKSWRNRSKYSPQRGN